MPRHRTVVPTLALLLAALAIPGSVAAAKDKDDKGRKHYEELEKALPEPYRAWLAEVDVLISQEERRAFLEIDKDYQRDAFIERFWRERDPFPDSTRNEFKERWDALVEEARRRYSDLKDERARMLLLNDAPTAWVESNCTQLLWPLEVWFYRGSRQVGFEFFIVFHRKWGVGPWRMWHPMEGLAELFRPESQHPRTLQEVALSCRDGDFLAAGIASVLREGASGYSLILARLETRPEAPAGEWVKTFAAYSTDLPEAAAAFSARLAVDYPGRKQARTIVQGILHVPVAEVALADLAGSRSYNFVLTGEVLREAKLFDSFRYKFDLPHQEVQGDDLPLVFERYLRPGSYTLVLKLEDLNGKQFFRAERPIEVPQVEGTALLPPPPADPETARLLAEANRLLATGDHSLKIVPPTGELHTGRLRVDTLAAGGDFDRVTFYLDGKAILTKTRPPFSVELDLGELPRTRTLRVAGFDQQGEELASDELLLNSGGHRFALRLVEPRSNKQYQESLRAVAEVEVPDGATLERVEFYLNEQLLATLYQPPFAQPVLLPEQGALTYVRAVAFLTDGNATEDTVFVNAPDIAEEIDIQFVELYTTVLDSKGRPVEGLGRGQFSVSEDGVGQEIRRFEVVRDLPIHAGILLDVSASMEEDLDQARNAALRFFEHTVQPKDRAAVITFNDRPNLAVKFTNEVKTLAGGLAGLKAERGTALYDSLIFALYYFNGIKGQRAILVLSDGKDESSRFSFEDTLEYARRAGVTIYAIGLNLNKKHSDAKRKLARLADETGGRSFFIDSSSQLEAIYDSIQEELRSQYLIAYQSSNMSGDTAFRTVELKVDRSGLEVKTIRGYYP